MLSQRISLLILLSCSSLIPCNANSERITIDSTYGYVYIEPNGVYCPPSCEINIDAGRMVTMTPTPYNDRIVFWYWDGSFDACWGTRSICSFIAEGGRSDRIVRANFTLSEDVPLFEGMVSVTVTDDDSALGATGFSLGGIVSVSPPDLYGKKQLISGQRESFRFSKGADVILTATPQYGSVFSGWVGDCNGMSSSCSLTADQFKLTAAIFKSRGPDIQFEIYGPGCLEISEDRGGSTKLCPGKDGWTRTYYSFPVGAIVRAKAVESIDGYFVRFLGNSCDLISNKTCTLSTVIENNTYQFYKNYIHASFAWYTYPLSMSLNGSGILYYINDQSRSVACSGENITCTSDFNSSTTVTLTAVPGSGWIFSKWGGACSGTGSCVVAMNAAKSVTASFTQTVSSYPLTVTKSGSGTVTSNPAGINCGTDCSETYSGGTTVTLTATPESGWQFTGWGGACSGTGSCVVAMNAAKSVTASFQEVQSTKYNLYSYTAFTGFINNGSAGINYSPGGTDCGLNCDSYNTGTIVTLNAYSTGYTFTGWSGDCWGANPCVLTMDLDHTVTANFSATLIRNLTVTKTGNGTISSLSPNASIYCGTACQGSFSDGQLVTLFAQPDKGNTFMGWSGPAAGTCGRQTTCSVYMSSNQSISADFKNTYVLIQPAIQLLLSD